MLHVWDILNFHWLIPKCGHTDNGWQLREFSPKFGDFLGLWAIRGLLGEF
jgi:hypothetical protein